MALTLVIESTARPLKVGTLDLQETINGRASLRAGVVSVTGAYIPSVDDDVELKDGATVIFKGIIVNTLVTYLAMGAGLVTTIEAADYSHYAERRVVRASTGGGISGRDAIDYLVTNFLATYGVTRDPAMPAGATLGALSYDYARVNEVLDDIVRLAAPSGWIWKIDSSKVLTALQPSTTSWPCPFSVSNATSNIVGDITIRALRESYANRVIFTYGDGSPVAATVISDNASEQSARGIYEVAISSPGPLDAATAKSICDGYLTQLSATPTQIEFVTREAGAHAGQTIAVTLTARGLSGNYMITDVGVYDVGGVEFYRITAISGSVPVQTWRETYRLWADRSTPRGGVGWGTYTPGLVLFSEDFESGSTLATLGFVDYSGVTTNLGSANTTGAGMSGTTWGVVSSDDYPEVGHAVPSPGYGTRRDGWVEFWTDFSRLQEGGWTFVAAMAGNFSSTAVPVFDLVVGTDSGDRKFWLYSGYTYPTVIAEGTNLFTANTRQLVRVAWRQSTWSNGVPVADGELTVFINGAQIWRVTGLTLAQGSGTDAIEIARLYTNPCGTLDELRFGYGAVTSTAAFIVAGTVTSTSSIYASTVSLP